MSENLSSGAQPRKHEVVGPSDWCLSLATQLAALSQGGITARTGRLSVSVKAKKYPSTSKRS